MTPIQQLYLGVGAKKKTYLDDIFSTYVYRGDGQSTRTITNGIDLAGEGGLIWTKIRTSTNSHIVNDTARGITNLMYTNASDGQFSNSNRISSVTSTGYVTGDNGDVNASNNDYASWSFRKAPGFFDVVTYTGNSTTRTISHSLGCVPGLIMIKQTNSTSSWSVYHRSQGAGKRLYLNTTDAAFSSSAWNSVMPTSTNFTVSGAIGDVNSDGNEFVAYVFAGGESTAATARSVDFTPNSNASLTLSGHSDLDAGTGDYSVEGWINTTFTGTTRQNIFHSGGADNGSLYVGIASDQIYVSNYNAYILQANTGYGGDNESGQWIHVAACRSGSTLKIFKNGIEVASGTDSGNYTSSSGNTASIGFGGAMGVKGKLSNVRFVKGTAVYTSSFRPPTEPLTNITNTKLLCCNNSSASGATVTPNTITVNHSAAASTDSPFDDPAAFTFGENGDQSIVKTGSYTGNGAAAGPEVYVGWEPQYLLLKNASIDGSDSTWHLADNMRGVVSGGTDAKLVANATTAESSVERLDFTSTGFKLKDSNPEINGSTNTIVYLAIRRPDGYCGKPAEAGTDVFTMDTGNSSSTIPTFDSGFPVDMALYKEAAATASWNLASRQTGSSFVYPNRTDVESSNSNYTWDSNVGWSKNGDSAYYQSWMWKRHAGFDVICYKGNSGIQHIAHSLGKVPEMMWIKRRTGGSGDNWGVYHKGLDGGTNPQGEYLRLNQTNAETGDTAFWDNSLPTTTHFTVGNDTKVNNSSGDYMAMLFSSISGISKVGSYTGSSGSVTLDLGFSPRFLIIKRRDGANSWMVFDTLRGIPAGNDPVLMLNSSSAQDTNDDYLDVTSSGVTINNIGENSTNNGSSMNYIYYAHA